MPRSASRPLPRRSCRTLVAMKLQMVSLVVTLLLGGCTSVRAEPVSEKDIDLLMQRATAFANAFNTGDVKAYVDMMHSSIKALGISREQMFLTVQDSMTEIPRMGIVLEKVTLERPQQCYEASNEAVCFVPRQMVIRTKGIRQLYRGYLLAGKASGGPFEWHFLDSDGFRTNPERLFLLFPALQRDAKIPPIRVEPLP